MIYYEENEKGIEKYLVEFNKEELEKLRLEIIDNCSEITHYEYDGINGPYYEDKLKYRNYKQEQKQVEETKDIESFKKIIYHYSFDRYDFPYLVTIVDNLLAGDVNAVNEIMNPNRDKERLTFQEKVEIRRKELDQTSYANPKEKIAKMNEFKQFLDDNKLNHDQKDVWEYYEKVKEMITLSLIDSITKENIEKFESFFDVTVSKDVKKKYRLKSK